MSETPANTSLNNPEIDRSVFVGYASKKERAQLAATQDIANVLHGLEGTAEDDLVMQAQAATELAVLFKIYPEVFENLNIENHVTKDKHVLERAMLDLLPQIRSFGGLPLITLDAEHPDELRLVSPQELEERAARLEALAESIWSQPPSANFLAYFKVSLEQYNKNPAVTIDNFFEEATFLEDQANSIHSVYTKDSEEYQQTPESDKLCRAKRAARLARVLLDPYRDPAIAAMDPDVYNRLKDSIIDPAISADELMEVVGSATESLVRTLNTRAHDYRSAVGTVLSGAAKDFVAPNLA